MAQLAILHNLKRLLAGETAINMKVTEFPDRRKRRRPKLR